MIPTKHTGLVPHRQSECVNLIAGDKSILISIEAYIMLADGYVERVSDLQIGQKLYNVGEITEVVRVGSMMCYISLLHQLENIDGFVLCLWERPHEPA